MEHAANLLRPFPVRDLGVEVNIEDEEAADVPEWEQGGDPVVAAKHQGGCLGATVEGPPPSDHNLYPGPICRALEGFVQGWHGHDGGLQVPQLMQVEDVGVALIDPKVRQGRLQGDASLVFGHDS